MDWDDYQRWKSDPVTKRVVKYLQDCQEELIKLQGDNLVNKIKLSTEDFISQAERYATLDDVVNLNFEEIEAFYDSTSVGQISR